MTDNETIKALQEALLKKDKEIEKLKEEKEILFRLSLKNTKKKLEEKK